ncbi:unnamed protein product [Pleuronectes platessa]|uniref:Uncharacterized protein n=1 Tax=Pleuronectes platessa TaxID=8262 RepID=A0A9N7V237_PLEPL|nr:unnamed protein product [Pleuronectes platessa]
MALVMGVGPPPPPVSQSLERWPFHRGHSCHCQQSHMVASPRFSWDMGGNGDRALAGCDQISQRTGRRGAVEPGGECRSQSGEASPLTTSVEKGQCWPACGVPHCNHSGFICDSSERELNSRWRHGLYSLLPELQAKCVSSWQEQPTPGLSWRRIKKKDLAPVTQQTENIYTAGTLEP